MRALFRKLFPEFAWDWRGRLKYLLSREADLAACAVRGVPLEVTAQALRLFCDAFDIPDEQLYCLRPGDRIHDIYCAMVRGISDHMEYEQLFISLDETIGRELSESELTSIETIEDLVRFVHANSPRSP